MMLCFAAMLPCTMLCAKSFGNNSDMWLRSDPMSRALTQMKFQASSSVSSSGAERDGLVVTAHMWTTLVDFDRPAATAAQADVGACPCTGQTLPDDQNDNKRRRAMPMRPMRAKSFDTSIDNTVRSAPMSRALLIQASYH